MVDERLAHQSKGVFYLRIEDTDRKREVEGGVQMIIDAFKSFGLPFDEVQRLMARPASTVRTDRASVLRSD